MNTARRTVILAPAAAVFAWLSWPTKGWTAPAPAGAMTPTLGNISVLASAVCRSDVLARLLLPGSEMTWVIDADFNDVPALAGAIRSSAGRTVLALVTHRDHVMVNEAVRLAKARIDELPTNGGAVCALATTVSARTDLVSFIVTA